MDFQEQLQWRGHVHVLVDCLKGGLPVPNRRVVAMLGEVLDIAYVQNRELLVACDDEHHIMLCDELEEFRDTVNQIRVAVDLEIPPWAHGSPHQLNHHWLDLGHPGAGHTSEPAGSPGTLTAELDEDGCT